MLKRIISLILCLVMLISAVPVQAFAGEAENEPTELLRETEGGEESESVTEPPEETAVPAETVTEPAGETAAPEEAITEPTEETDILMEPAAERIPVTSIEITAETDCIAPGETLQLTATVLPENATDQTVIWSSEDESVLTVDENGLVTGIADGCTFVVVTAADGVGWKHGMRLLCLTRML